MTKPYYQDSHCTIYHGDCRELLGRVQADTVVTDPVWPNSVATLIGAERPHDLFREFAAAIPSSVRRLAVQLGCDSCPSILAAVPSRLAFFRVCWLEIVFAHCKGRVLYGSDVAYLFGAAPRWRPGHRVIPGRMVESMGRGQEADHPCPRKLAHVGWLVKWWTEPDDVVLDPFMGAGTTL